ncbi:MAG: hypothetical protein RIB59_05510 [Rhodospirillales bacterium]
MIHFFIFLKTNFTCMLAVMRVICPREVTASALLRGRKVRMAGVRKARRGFIGLSIILTLLPIAGGKKL